MVWHVFEDNDVLKSLFYHNVTVKTNTISIRFDCLSARVVISRGHASDLKQEITWFKVLKNVGFVQIIMLYKFQKYGVFQFFYEKQKNTNVRFRRFHKNHFQNQFILYWQNLSGFKFQSRIWPDLKIYEKYGIFKGFAMTSFWRHRVISADDRTSKDRIPLVLDKYEQLYGYMSILTFLKHGIKKKSWNRKGQIVLSLEIFVCLHDSELLGTECPLVWTGHHLQRKFSWRKMTVRHGKNKLLCLSKRNISHRGVFTKGKWIVKEKIALHQCKIRWSVFAIL